jgi:glucose 1-dehydrogenase
MKLAGKVVLITGASTGIGRALALGMAQEGANIIVNHLRDAAGAAEVVAQIEQIGRCAREIDADVSQIHEIEMLFRQTRATFGKLDVLVNNAGVTGWTDLFHVTEAQWNQVIDTNLKGTFFCSQQAARLMREQGGGNIINISSNCAALGVKNLAVYAASKGGIHALTRQLAVELAPYNIRVNTFAPGPTQVERNLRDDPDYDQTWGRMVPLQRTALPEEMVGPAVFLASEDSSYMTGQVFFVDGGWTVCGKIPEAHMDSVLEKNGK